MRFGIMLGTAVTVAGLASSTLERKRLRAVSSRCPSEGRSPLSGRASLRRLCPDAIRGRADHQGDGGNRRPDHRPRRSGASERTGSRRASTRMVYLRGDRGRPSPTPCRRRSSRSARASASPGTSITGRPRPTPSTSPGPAATAGSTPCDRSATTMLVATPGGYIAPGQDIVRAGPNGLLETPVAAGDDITWFPNLYDDLTFRGADGTLYQTPSPLLKYDQLFNTSARNWEAANSQNQDIQRWPGHCLGGAVGLDPAERADARPRLGHDPGRAEGALGRARREPLQPPDRRLRERDPPRPAAPRLRRVRPLRPPVPPDARDPHPRRQAGAAGQPPRLPPRGTVNEVWNHGIGKYIATYHAIPGKGVQRGPARGRAPRQLRIEPQRPGRQAAGRSSMSTPSSTASTAGSTRPTPTPPTGSRVGGEALFAPLNILWSSRHPLARPQPDGHRGQRPGARHGQRRRLHPVRRRPAAIPPVRNARGESLRPVRLGTEPRFVEFFPSRQFTALAEWA